MNVIVVIIDSLRKDHVGAYGNVDMHTPNLDALAAESLRFDQAHPEAMPTIPARRAIHTGRRTWPSPPTAYGWTAIPDYEPTLAEILKREGYRTALATDTYHQYEFNFERGFDEYRRIRGQEYDSYRDPSLISEAELSNYLVLGGDGNDRQYLANVQGRRSEEDYFPAQVFLEAAGALEQVSRSSRPFFLVADCYDPHEPWDPPEKYKRIYDPDGYSGREPFIPKYDTADYLTDTQLLRMRTLYAAEASMADHWLGNFLNRAEELGVMEDTLIVLISDHGHALGEHGATGKPPWALWPEILDVPFFIRHPSGNGAGQTSGYYASTHDVAPTVLGALGVEQPSPPMEGEDLSVLLDGKTLPQRSYITSGLANYAWCRDERYVMFCRNDMTDARLYDLFNDPDQTRSLADEYPDTVRSMFENYILKDAGGSMPT